YIVAFKGSLGEFERRHLLCIDTQGNIKGDKFPVPEVSRRGCTLLHCRSDVDPLPFLRRQDSKMDRYFSSNYICMAPISTGAHVSMLLKGTNELFYRREGERCCHLQAEKVQLYNRIKDTVFFSRSDSGVPTRGRGEGGIDAPAASFRERTQATRGLLWDGPRNLEPSSDDENDTWDGTLLRTSPPHQWEEVWPPTYDLMCNSLTYAADRQWNRV
ncbi:hypothetical protein AVEN_264564-1, partial [Araneus ventricosus]